MYYSDDEHKRSMLYNAALLVYRAKALFMGHCNLRDQKHQVIKHFYSSEKKSGRRVRVGVRLEITKRNVDFYWVDILDASFVCNQSSIQTR